MTLLESVDLSMLRGLLRNCVCSRLTDVEVEKYSEVGGGEEGWLSEGNLFCAGDSVRLQVARQSSTMEM